METRFREYDHLGLGALDKSRVADLDYAACPYADAFADNFCHGILQGGYGVITNSSALEIRAAFDDEDDPLSISALQHYVYCPRQCALIHVEQVWDENVFTMRGNRAHERVDTPGFRTRDGERTVRALDVWSTRLAIVGRADVVVFDGAGKPYPVEHKVGARRARRADEVQLCAQALCLEEMFGHPVPEGALFYGRTRRRRNVRLDEELRAETERVISETRELLRSRRLPVAPADSRCTKCSLIEACMPHARRRLRQLEE